MTICSTSLASTTIIDTENIPSLNIIGSRTRNLFISNSLILEGNATLKHCNGNWINTGFIYQWSIRDVENGMTLSQIQSLSKSKFRFLLEPFTLYPDKTYIVTFKVTHSISNSQSYDEIIINSKKGNIIAKFDTNSINIGNYISISPDKKLKISTRGDNVV